MPAAWRALTFFLINIFSQHIQGVSFNNYKNIRTYFSVFLGDEVNAYGETSPQVVDSSIKVIGAVDSHLIDEIDQFLAEHLTNELAAPAMNLITKKVGGCAGYHLIP